MVVVNVISHAQSKDKILQQYIREISYMVATNHCEITVKYIDTKSNFLSNILSRMHMASKYRKQWQKLLIQTYRVDKRKSSKELYGMVE